MKNNHIISIFFFLLASPLLLFGQDPAYSQFSNTPMYFNPAYTGLYNGLRVRFSTRNQDPAYETSFRSYHLSADITDRNLPGSGGFGLILNSDNEGLRYIKNYNLGVSFSVRVPFTNYIVGQIGIKAAWLKKNIVWDEFARSESLNEKYGNIHDSDFIRPDINVLNLPDFAIGGLVQFTNSNGCMSGTAGVALDHLFEPDVSFIQTVETPLPRKWIGHADVIWAVKCRSGSTALSDKILRINPGVVFQQQDGLNTYMGGIQVTRYGLYFGLWYLGQSGSRNYNAVTILGGYRYAFAENMSIKFTYSYDKQIPGSMPKTGGAHEISLILDFDAVRLFKETGRSSFRSGVRHGFDIPIANTPF